MANEYILEMKNITKIFPGVKALDDVTLKVRPATVHSLMGENGAGKSTLMNWRRRSGTMYRWFTRNLIRSWTAISWKTYGSADFR